ncbi:hypothetical protein ACFE04_019692 [Oxalis oulophora]
MTKQNGHASSSSTPASKRKMGKQQPIDESLTKEEADMAIAFRTIKSSEIELGHRSGKRVQAIHPHGEKTGKSLLLFSSRARAIGGRVPGIKFFQLTQFSGLARIRVTENREERKRALGFISQNRDYAMTRVATI